MTNFFDIDQFSLTVKLLVDRAPLLARYTTFQLGGPCPFLISAQSPEDLRSAVACFQAHNIHDFLVIGEGSNILFSDAGISIPVIRYYSTTPQIVKNYCDVTVAASTKLDDLALFCAHEGLEGLGFASGIPGTVGGAIAGNAGAFGKQVSDALFSVVTVGRDGIEKEYAAQECDFDYRRSRFQASGEIILTARFLLKKNSPEATMKERSDLLAQRKEKHPDYRTVPCAGSFFKNIDSLVAGQRRQAAGLLLDQAGAKQMSVGGAGVFEKHANIIIKKTESCTARDVYLLSRQMQDAVEKKFEIVLKPEVRFWGEF